MSQTAGRETERYLEKADKDSCEGSLAASDAGEGPWSPARPIVGRSTIWTTDYYEDIASHETYHRINNPKARVNVLGTSQLATRGLVGGFVGSYKLLFVSITIMPDLL
jgi:hypothetical protein